MNDNCYFEAPSLNNPSWLFQEVSDLCSTVLHNTCKLFYFDDLPYATKVKCRAASKQMYSLGLTPIADFTFVNQTPTGITTACPRSTHPPNQINISHHTLLPSIYPPAQLYQLHYPPFLLTMQQHHTIKIVISQTILSPSSHLTVLMMTCKPKHPYNSILTLPLPTYVLTLHPHYLLSVESHHFHPIMHTSLHPSTNPQMTCTPNSKLLLLIM
jgi:hypothetical protein